MIIDNKFDLEAIVYLVTDPDQYERMVTRLIVAINCTILYELSCGTDTSLHYAAEITSKKNMELALGIKKDSNNG
jgi:hypothetical protein